MIQQNNSNLFPMCADQTACCAAVRLWFLSLSYISGWADLHILAPASLCIVMCFKLHVKNLHELEVIITKIFRYTLNCPFADFTKANPGILYIVWFADDTLGLLLKIEIKNPKPPRWCSTLPNSVLFCVFWCCLYCSSSTNKGECEL